MCRSIKTLFHFEPPATDDEIRAASLQFVRKLSGMNAPAKINARMMSLAYVTLFLDNLAVGNIGSIYERMTPTAFWMLNTAIALAGAAIALAFGPMLTRALRAGETPR